MQCTISWVSLVKYGSVYDTKYRKPPASVIKILAPAMHPQGQQVNGISRQPGKTEYNYALLCR
jgi:hypothetical protein